MFIILKRTSENITFDQMGRIDKITDEFLFVENPESMPGPGLIMQNKPPFLMGKVVNFKDRHEMQDYVERKGFLGSAKRCIGYYICIIPIESLMSEPVLNSKMHEAFEGMANFYLEKKIMKNEGYYKRYKEKN